MKEPLTVEGVLSEISVFSAFDYAVFCGVLLGCASLGIYYSHRGRKDTDFAREYLTGGRTMSVFPVALSLLASCTSGLTLLGVPAEIYLHGTEYAFVFIPILLTGFLSSYLLLPVFHEMELISSFEYLERRFDRNVRFLGAFVFTIAQIFWLPVVVHLPALALHQVTGVNVHVLTPCVCILCICYTCLGGLKGVVATDAMLMLLTAGSMILVSLKGSLDAGGFNEVWRRNNEGSRLVIPTFEADLTIRHSFWALTFGGLIMFVQGSVLDQKVLQRYLSLSSLSRARRYGRGCPRKVPEERVFQVWVYLFRTLWVFAFGWIALILLLSYAGLVIYAFYQECDPLTTNLATGSDQLLPLLVMRVFSHFPGLPGLFVAGIFSAALSSLSTGLNALSAVVLEDFIKPFLSNGVGTRATDFILRGSVVIFGTLLLVLLLSVEKLSGLLQVSMSLGSITSGPLLGMFVSGVFLPWVNAKGALFGGLLALFASGFVIVGAQASAASYDGHFFPKPTSVEGCLYYYNATVLASSSNPHTGAVFPLFRLSYFWYTALGGFITVALALIISATTGFSDLRHVHPVCFSPIIRGCLPPSVKLLTKEELLLRELKKIKFDC